MTLSVLIPSPRRQHGSPRGRYKMVPLPEPPENHVAHRAAVLALHNALCTLRQHPDQAPLARTALRRCEEELGTATAHGPLTLGLRLTAVQLGAEDVLTFAANDAPFGLLRLAGIGQVVLSKNFAAENVPPLVQSLVKVTDEASAERWVRDQSLSGVLLRAATLDGTTPDEACSEWARLAIAEPTSEIVSALIARDQASNLPALAAQQCLLDLDRECIDHDTTLARLLARMLERRDLATASWLLAEVDHHEGVAPSTRRLLHQQAIDRADNAWLQHHLDHGTRDELMNLTAFVMQLGERAAERFADLVAAASHPFSRWLSGLLGHQNRQ